MKKALFFFIMNVIYANVNAQLIKPVAEDYSTRQVHLDFHTSEHLPDIGTKFNKEHWQDQLQKANVTSINIFAKGHHGYSYYPSKVGTQHPNLKFDLLQAQIDACHEIGIKCPLYFAVGWSVLDTKKYPECVIRDRDGNSTAQGKFDGDQNKPLPYYTWDLMMPDGRYLSDILKQTEELCKNYDVDGFWYDIIPINNLNYSDQAKEMMIAEGVDIENSEAVERFHIQRVEKFMVECNSIIKKHHPNASIFYNWTTHMSESYTFKYGLYRYNTSFDLEDLPTTWDGYNVFPLRAKFFANEGKPITGMTGKFHTAWGEFGGFKYPNALKYEAASMIAFGANVNIGDQLHPLGLLEESTYDNIAKTYDYVKEIEAFGANGKPLARTALWMTPDNEVNQATALLLLETQTNFMVANNLSDWSDIEVLIIPSAAGLSTEDVQRINKYLAQGGKIIAFAEGVLSSDRSEFVLDIDGQYIGDASFDVDYTVVEALLEKDVVTSRFLNDIPCMKIKPNADVEILASIHEPYFSRTKAHYTSHRNTPYQLEKSEHPAVYKTQNIIVIAHPLDRIYQRMGSQIHRELFENILELQLEKPYVSVDMMSSARLNLLSFPYKKRYVAHVLYATPIQRGEAQVIEDLPTIYDTKLTVNFDEKVKRAYLIPGNKPLSLESQDDGTLEVIIPAFSCHTAVVFEY